MGDNSPAILVLVLLAAFAVFAMIMIMAIWLRDRRRSQARIEQLLQDRERSLSDARRESVEKSRSSLKGQIAEQMAPLLPGFLYLPADARFLGDPIDYVVFNGYTEVRDDRAGNDALEIVLLEIKQGRSALTGFQKAIAGAIQQGRVRFEICRILDDGSVGTETWRPGKQGGHALR